MPCQAKTEPLEYLHLETVQTVLDSHDLLYGIGYRGTLTTTGESARLDLSLPNQATVAAAVGDVILYRTTPAPAVVDCLPYDDFIAGYDITT